MSSTTASTSRSVIKSVYSQQKTEGVGAKVRRSIGTPALKNLSPFLMLDEFTVPKGAGFPDHPHRGQSTITYMLEGKVQHEDFTGNKGTIGPGDLQWMTAGKGIVHAEMPLFEDENSPNAHGLQLWVDLPEDKKFCEPSYQEKKGVDIDKVSPTEGVEITVISGESHGVKGFVRPVGGCWYMDFKMSKPGATVFQPIPEGWTAFLYILKGQVSVGDEPFPHSPHTTVVLSSAKGEDGVKLVRPENTPDDTHFVLIAGEPLNQRVIQYGPFVVNTAQQVQDAFMDYQMGQNGFENAPGWSSEIGKAMAH